MALRLPHKSVTAVLAKLELVELLQAFEIVLRRIRLGMACVIRGDLLGGLTVGMRQGPGVLSPDLPQLEIAALGEATLILRPIFHALAEIIAAMPKLDDDAALRPFADSLPKSRRKIRQARPWSLRSESSEVRAFFSSDFRDGVNERAVSIEAAPLRTSASLTAESYHPRAPEAKFQINIYLMQKISPRFHIKGCGVPRSGNIDQSGPGETESHGGPLRLSQLAIQRSGFRS